jgi:DNA-directed RNA polymerase specialized sigma subunit
MLVEKEKKKYLERYALLEESGEMNEEKNEQMKAIEQAVSSLENEVEKEILYLKYIGYHVNGKRKRINTLWEIGNILGYSESRIKFYHGNALKNLKIGTD